jgi:hypothetical protein
MYSELDRRDGARTERVSDAHLAGLRRDGVSYIFAGEQELDLGLALEILNRGQTVSATRLAGGSGLPYKRCAAGGRPERPGQDARQPRRGLRRIGAVVIRLPTAVA